MDDIIRQAIHDFRAYLQRRHYAAHTLANYTLDLQLFFAACPQPLAQVSFQDIEQFLEWEYQQDLAPTTIHRRLHALKHFFDYLVEQRRITGNPVKPSHMVRRGRPSRKPSPRTRCSNCLPRSTPPWIRRSSCSCSGVACGSLRWSTSHWTISTGRSRPSASTKAKAAKIGGSTSLLMR
jgi:hypothetical protein